MAELPEGSRPLQNSAGSAPAVFCTFGSSQIVALPGVPKELRTIFLEEVQSMISKSLPPFKQMQKWINVTGVGEPKIAPYIAKIMQKYSPEIYIKSHALGFRKGKSVLKIQLIATTPERYSDIVDQKLADATEQMKGAALKLGGKVELTNTVQ
jgi:molybdopterin-biosynthesis enzyme MoeA-like protein